MDGGGGNSLPSSSCPDGNKRRVSYFYNPAVADYVFGEAHTMQPQRVRMAQALISSYGLIPRMAHVRTPAPATENDLLVFHTDDYVDFLRDVTPRNVVSSPELKADAGFYNVGPGSVWKAGGGIGGFHEDGENPAFNGLFEYCCACAGGSLAAAQSLNSGEADIAIHWAGGASHARASQAKGYGYVNDVVLAIHKLFDKHKRILYVDIDVYHGDGVEEAFYTTDKVMTVSFHLRGDVFPYTGKINDIGYEDGLYYNLNVPLEEGIDDESYHSVFKPIMGRVMEVFNPDAVVLRSGADSLSGERHGGFNLSIRGHAECVKYMRSFNVPLLLLGGCGYTLRNIASCWCYETGVALGVEIGDKIPEHCYSRYYAPDYSIHVPIRTMQNKNTRKSLEDIKSKVFKYLSKLERKLQNPKYDGDGEDSDEDEEDSYEDEEGRDVSP